MIPERLKSRKFLLAVFGVAGFIFLGISGQMSWEEVGGRVQLLILGYLAAEGLIDYGRVRD